MRCSRMSCSAHWSLLEGTGAIQVGAAGLLREALGVLDQALGVLRRQHLHEMAAPHLEHAIDEAFEFRGSRHGQMPFEDHAIKTMQRADDEAGKLGQKPPYCAHGILPRLAVRKHQPFWRMNAIFASSFPFAALPR